MKDYFKWINILVFLLLIVSLTANIMIGSLLNNFQKDFYRRSDNAIKDRRVMMVRDSVNLLQNEALLKGQISIQQQLNDLKK